MHTTTVKLASKPLLKKRKISSVVWEIIVFVVQKQYKKKQKKIVFIVFNKLVKQILGVLKNEIITIIFYLYCAKYNRVWHTSLKEIEVEKYVSKKRIKESIRDGGEPSS